MKLFESEQKVMEVLWEEGEVPAKRVAEVLKESIGWNKNTTYTVIKKCIAKGAIERSEPGFLCRPLIERREFESYEIQELLNRTFKGSRSKFLSAFLEEEALSVEELKDLEEMIQKKVK